MKKTLLIIVTVFILFSCGAKQSNKSQSTSDSIAKQLEVAQLKIAEFEKLSKKSDSTSNGKKETTINSSSTGLEFEPSDPTKESSVTTPDGKTTKFQNAKVKTKTEKVEVFIEDTTSVRLWKESESIVNRYKDSVKIKNIEIAMMKESLEKSKVVEQFNWGTFMLQTWYWWLLIALAIYVSWKLYKKQNPFSFIKNPFA